MVGEAFDLEFAMNASTYLQYYLFVNDIYPKWKFFLQTIHYLQQVVVQWYQNMIEFTFDEFMILSR